MVNYIRNIILYRKFKMALKKCEKMNHWLTYDLYFVANIMGQPVIVNRSTFRLLRTKGKFRHDLKWEDVKAKCITHETLKQWTS